MKRTTPRVVEDKKKNNNSNDNSVLVHFETPISALRFAIEAFSSSNYFAINKVLLQTYGPNLAVFICVLIDRLRYFVERDMLSADGSFYLTQKNQMQETGMTAPQIRTCKKALIESGLISIEERGMPKKHYYTIDPRELLEVLYGITSGKESEAPDITISDHLPYINKTKDKKIKARSAAHKKIRKRWSESFRVFLAHYPKKVEQGKAYSEWMKIPNREDPNMRPDLDEIIDAIKAQKKSDRWRASAQYIPRPDYWIKDSRWLDDPRTMKPPSKNNIGRGRPGNTVRGQNTSKFPV